MRIVIDMQGAQTASRFRGIGRYTTALTRGILRNAGTHEVWLVLNGAMEESIAAIRADFSGLVPQERIRVFEVPGHVAGMDTGNAWRCRAAEMMREQFIALLDPDIVLVTSLFEGYVDDAVGSVGTFVDGRRTAVILYDLIPLLNPDAYLGSPSQRKHYMRKIDSLRRAGLLLAISDYAREEAIAALNLHPAHVVAISTAVDESFVPEAVTPAALTALREQFGITRSVIMCAPGGYDPRKNLVGLVTAYSLLPPALRAAHQLLIASRLGPNDRQELLSLAQRRGLAPDELILTGYVSDKTLIALYQAATLFVFPSLHEGFGMPVLEAMACGTPSIGSNSSSIPEVVGLNEAMFDPTRPQSIADKMAEILSDRTLYERLRAYGPAQAAKFSWDNTAVRALRAFETHVGETSAPIPRARSELLQALATVPRLPDTDPALLELALCLAAFPDTSAPRQLLIDVNLFQLQETGSMSPAWGPSGSEDGAAAWHDVVQALLRNPPEATQVELIYLSQRGGTSHFRYARRTMRAALGLPDDQTTDPIADVRTGDLVLYTAGVSVDVANAVRDGLFAHLRRIGVELHLLAAPDTGKKDTSTQPADTLHELCAHASQIIHGLCSVDTTPQTGPGKKKTLPITQLVQELLTLLSLPRLS